MRPPGALAWAHDIKREHRVLGALESTAVLTPTPYNYCSDATLIGGEFYLMSFIEGRIIDDCRLPGMSAPERRAIYTSFVRAFAALHAVDFAALGLSDFGKAENFVARQLALHTRNFRQYRPAGNPDMDWLIEWLPQHIPARSRPSIVHNDIRLGNVVLHPTEPRVIAILDWEMATLGDTFADAAFLTLPYSLPADNPQGTFQSFDTVAAGIPSAKELIAIYCKELGIDEFGDLAFMTAFNLFRYASVYAGIADRALKGQTVSDDAHRYEAVVASTARAAREVAESA